MLGRWGYYNPGTVSDVIVDNESAVYVGAWTLATSPAGFYGTNFRHDGNTGRGTKSATFAFPPVTVGGNYDIYTSSNTNASNCGRENVAVLVNDAPAQSSNGFNARIGGWALFSRFDLSPGDVVKVKITNPATGGGFDGYVIADAAKMVFVMKPWDYPEVSPRFAPPGFLGNGVRVSGAPGYGGVTYVGNSVGIESTLALVRESGLWAAGEKVTVEWKQYFESFGDLALYPDGVDAAGMSPGGWLQLCWSEEADSAALYGIFYDDNGIVHYTDEIAPCLITAGRWYQLSLTLKAPSALGVSDGEIVFRADGYTGRMSGLCYDLLIDPEAGEVQLSFVNGTGSGSLQVPWSAFVADHKIWFGDPITERAGFSPAVCSPASSPISNSRIMVPNRTL